MPKTDLTPEQGVIFAQIAMKLSALHISAELLSCEPGPIVTTYYLRLGADCPIAKILKAEEDIALATQSPSVLVSRHKGRIAIAVPNVARALVDFDQCLHSLLSGEAGSYKLPILLGVDTKGTKSYLDLADCPHILIAGSTGAGKSILLSAIIAGLATTKSPREMKLILCDTKQLELPLFKALPHVVGVADNLNDVHTHIDKLMGIVRQRTEKMKGLARNLPEYNKIMRETGSRELSYYVVVIDELADILMQDRSRAKGVRGYDKIEHKLQNLLQICRASGVHIICATQRPSVEIITGDIKANMPTRIALRLPSGADSRTVLNEYGAEQLLGRGDMLIESPTLDQITRFHGPYISLEHIANVLINSEQIRDSYRMCRIGE